MSTLMREKTLVVGILLYPGFEVLDVFGPGEVFGSSRFPCQKFEDPGRRPFQVVYLTETANPVPSGNGGGARVLPDAVINATPHLDIVLVPGGLGARTQYQNRALIDWIHAEHSRVEVMTSVCTGALLLAQTGLLHGEELAVQSGPEEHPQHAEDLSPMEERLPGEAPDPLPPGPSGVGEPRRVLLEVGDLDCLGAGGDQADLVDTDREAPELLTQVVKIATVKKMIRNWRRACLCGNCEDRDRSEKPVLIHRRIVPYLTGTATCPPPLAIPTDDKQKRTGRRGMES
jgi:putative intracellular protease/amidase